MENVDLHVDVPHSARVYDYLLGGKDNYEADRQVAERMIQASPGIRATVLANRRFMVRAARHLARDAGIRQFLDIGTGLPTSPNLHEVVQEVDPSCRVVYVDHDPAVLVHARALLVGCPEGVVDYVEADLRHPDDILGSAELGRTFDPEKPVAVSLIAVLHFVTDDDLARHVIRRLLAPLAPGSALAVSTLTMDGAPQEMRGVLGAAAAGGIDARLRTHAEVEAFFAGLDLVDPGVVRVDRWHPDPALRPGPGQATDQDVPVYGGVALKR